MRAPASPAAASLSLLLMATVVLLLSTRPLPVAANWYSELTSMLACPPCEADSCDVDPLTCEHGTARDHCQRLVCAK
ncbi:Protein of unknown function, partial [Gryllus bimaculatus]